MMRWLRWTLALLLLVAAGIGTGAWVLRNRVAEPFSGHAGAEQFVEIPSGASPISIGERLVETGIVRDPLTFRAAVWLSGRSRDLKAGQYRFTVPLTAAEVVDTLVRGDVYKRRITFPEGLTIAEMARLYEERGFGPARDFLAAASDASVIHDLDPAAKTLEGYLFPETYALAKETPASVLVEQMVRGFKAALDPTLRAEAVAAGWSVRQVVTLASLVEKETARPDERSLVAAVYANRLARGMPMQADPTVIYALQQAGRYDGNIRRSDLRFDSPYNTYRHPGLPPGPIAAPGRAALQAAVRPAGVGHLFFVSRNDGSHAFADTLAAHNRNVQQWQVQYFRRKRLAAAR